MLWPQMHDSVLEPERAPSSAIVAASDHRNYSFVSRLEISVAWSTPSLSQVPSAITLSPSLTWLESMSLTFLLPCSWLTHFVELSYWTVFSWLEPTLRTVSVD